MSHHDHDDDVVLNRSNNPCLTDLLQAPLSRRRALLGGLSATSVALLGGFSLAGCEDRGDGNGSAARSGVAAPKLGFDAVGKSLEDRVVLPDGYTASVLLALGDPLVSAVAGFVHDGSDGDFDRRAGDHHDGMQYFGLGDDGKLALGRSDRGLLCLNHENISQKYLHPAGASLAAPRDEAQVRKEMNCHGVSVVEIRRNGAAWETVADSAFNRRITPFTAMELNGPLRGSKFAVTSFSTDGTKTRGTLNNCANGYTPWGTYLTCEENWAGYFRRTSTDGFSTAELALHSRYGTTSSSGSFSWSSVGTAPDDIVRLDITIPDTTKTAASDYRNEANGYGWIVEIDPLQPTAAPRKRTALGRFGHEGCWPSLPKAGEPLAFYMGDDARGEYVYKFVSEARWDPADFGKGYAAGDKYLDKGTLYVARFKADGSGEWLALAHLANGLNEDNALFPFTSQSAVLVATRLAADSVGATRMDRPEWGAVNPRNGEVYLTLTNNRNRGSASQPVDAANPRNYSYADWQGTNSATSDNKGNVNGHVLRWREDGDSGATTSFRWDIYLFGAQSDGDATTVNLSGLDAANDFSSPDGLWFAPNGVLWIQTDDGNYTAATNCMMLAAVPGELGDGGETTVGSQKTFKGRNPGSDKSAALPGRAEAVRDHRHRHDAGRQDPVRQHPASRRRRHAGGPDEQLAAQQPQRAGRRRSRQPAAVGNPRHHAHGWWRHRHLRRDHNR